MKKINTVFITLCCIIIIYIIVVQILKSCLRHSFKKRIRKLHHLDISRDVIRSRLSGVGIYYINLNKATNRRSDMQTFIQKYNINNIQRIEGVYGKNVKDNTYTFSDGREIRIRNEYPSSDYNMAELGCFLSHVVALKTAYENGDEYALILEDDVDMNMVKVWDEGIKDVIQKAPENWNSIQLYESVMDLKNITYKNLPKNTYVPRTTYKYCGCVAYIMNRQSIKTFLEHLDCINNNTIHIKKIHTRLPIDFYMYDFFPPETVYMTNSRFITNNISNKTQIQTVTECSLINYETLFLGNFRA